MSRLRPSCPVRQTEEKTQMSRKAHRNVHVSVRTDGAVEATSHTHGPKASAMYFSESGLRDPGSHQEQTDSGTGHVLSTQQAHTLCDPTVPREKGTHSGLVLGTILQAHVM